MKKYSLFRSSKAVVGVALVIVIFAGACSSKPNMPFGQKRKNSQNQTGLPDIVLTPELENLRLSNPFQCSTSPSLVEDTIRPLSPREYANSMKFHFSEYIDFQDFEIEFESLPRRQMSDSNFSRVDPSLVREHFQSYFRIARSIAGNLAGNLEFVRVAFGNDTCQQGSSLSNVCLENFLDRYAPRLLRRSLDDEDRQFYSGIIRENTASAADQILLLLESMLQSPDFLFKLFVFGEEQSDGSLQLTDFELASRLSYALLETPPDSELWEKASRGELRNMAELQSQASRLLQAEQARAVSADFFVDWLHLRNSNLPSVSPAYLAGLELSDNYTAEVENEARRFVNYIKFDQAGTYRDLLLSPQLVEPSPTLSQVVGVNHDPKERPGILWRTIVAGSTLSTYRNLIHSGTIMREHLLCQSLPDAHPSLEEEIKAALELRVDDMSARDEVHLKTSAQSCVGCHARINPLAFAGANAYDSLGRFIQMDRRFSDDGQSEIGQFPLNLFIDDPVIDKAGEKPVEGPYELANSIAHSVSGYSCYVKEKYTHFTGRQLQIADNADSCALHHGFDALVSGRLRDASLSFINEAFLVRLPKQD